MFALYFVILQMPGLRPVHQNKLCLRLCQGVVCLGVIAFGYAPKYNSQFIISICRTNTISEHGGMITIPAVFT